MKVKALLFIFFTITLFALGVLITTIFNTAPTTNDVIGMFYISLFFTVFGLAFFGLYLFRFIRSQAQVGNLAILNSTRTAGVLALFAIIILLLQANSLLNWATVAVLLVAAVIGELMLRKRVLK